MKCKYLLIDEPCELTADSKFFNVWVGQTEKDLKALQFLEQFAGDNNLYLAKWSHDVSEFVTNIAASLNSKVHFLNFQNISVTALVRFIKQNQETPAAQPPTSADIYLRMQTSSDYFFKIQTDVLQSANSVTRKKPKSISMRIKA